MIDPTVYELWRKHLDRVSVCRDPGNPLAAHVHVDGRYVGAWTRRHGNAKAWTLCGTDGQPIMRPSAAYAGMLRPVDAVTTTRHGGEAELARDVARALSNGWTPQEAPAGPTLAAKAGDALARLYSHLAAATAACDEARGVLAQIADEQTQIEAAAIMLGVDMDLLRGRTRLKAAEPQDDDAPAE